MSDVVALAISDIHLSCNVPTSRSGEKDWYEAMGRSLKELNYLKNKYGVPVICAGDIFHKWDKNNSSPELINWAIRNLPEMYAISGQHDQPYHNLGEIHKSAYWTLVEAGVIINLEYMEPVELDNMILFGFPWGMEILPLDEKSGTKLHIAVIHHYLYTNSDNCYPGASINNKISSFKSKLSGYDIVISGDNHKSWECEL